MWAGASGRGLVVSYLAPDLPRGGSLGPVFVCLYIQY